MILHKEYALRCFCESPLELEGCRELLEKIWAESAQLQRLVFVTTRLPPEHYGSLSAGRGGVPFELSLGSESEQLLLVNGGLRRQTQKVRTHCLTDPAQAWETLQSYCGLIHVQLVFKGDTPDWYQDIAVPNEAVPPHAASGFASFSGSRLSLCSGASPKRADR